MSGPPSTSPMDSVLSETPSTSREGSVPGGRSCKVPTTANPAAQQKASVLPAAHEPNLAAQQKASVPPADGVPNLAAQDLADVPLSMQPPAIACRDRLI